MLHTKVADTLQLQSLGTEQGARYMVKVIGYLAGESLVVTTPCSRNGVVLVREGQMFNVRMLHGSSVQGFVSTVLHSSAKPYPHLHLSYPKQVESIVVRNAERAVSDLVAAVRNTRDEDIEENFHPVHIMDISLTGARLVSKKALGETGNMLQISVALEVCGKEEQLVLLGDVRRESKGQSERRNPNFQYGVQFLSLNRFQQVLVHGYVLEKLLQDHPQS